LRKGSAAERTGEGQRETERVCASKKERYSTMERTERKRKELLDK